jgi:hypothetical protein
LRLQLKGLTAAVCLSLVGALPRPALAEVMALSPRTTVFVEPSETSKLVVINPNAALSVTPSDWLQVDVEYEADIVSGATESLKGGRLSAVDIVSSARTFRHSPRRLRGFRFDPGNDTPHRELLAWQRVDYRSNAFAVSAGTTFLQKNTELSLAYARGFDQVCTTAFQSSDSASVRLPLDNSKGCFQGRGQPGHARYRSGQFSGRLDPNLDASFGDAVGLIGVASARLLGEPVSGGRDRTSGRPGARKSPDNRARAAFALRAKYYLRPIKTAFTAGARIYRDTWDVVGQTYEVEAERYLLPDLRASWHAALHTQGGALFWSDDYTGGEPQDGPRGQYWTGDRELSPLWSYLVGGRLVFRREGRPEKRIAYVMLGFEASLSLDLMKTVLEEFTWGGKAPDDTLALIGSLGARAAF